MAYDPTYKDYLLWRQQQSNAGTLLKELPTTAPQKAGAWPLQFSKPFSSYDPIDIAVSAESEIEENKFLNLMYSDKSYKSASMNEVFPAEKSILKKISVPKKTFKSYSKDILSSATNKWKGLQTYKKIGLGVGAVAVGLMFSGRDDSYNTIEGLHPGSNSIGASMIRNMTDFGSGYKGLPEELMGVPLDKEILKYRKDVIEDKDKYREIQRELRVKEKEAQKTIGGFEESDFNRTVKIDNFRILSQLNYNNKKLKQVNLDKFKVNVEDADTLILQRKGLFSLFDKDVVIRMAGIDAPETAAHEDDVLETVRYKQGQIGGETSTKVLERLVSEQKNLSLIVGGDKTYGRYVGALVGDKSILNVDLAREGAVTSLPFGEVGEDVIFRDAVARAEQSAKKEEAGIWENARYKAIDKVRNTLGQPITYNTLTRIDKIAQNLNLAAYSSFVEGFGSEKRDLSYEEQVTARRIGYALRKTHGPDKRKYNKNDGLHPGSEGLGAQSIRKHSDFGSGWRGAIRLVDKQEAVQYAEELYEENKTISRKKAAHKIDYLLNEGKVHSIYQKLGNGVKFSAMPNRGTAAASIRGQLTEFKEDFASRWDKLKNIASKIYGHSDDAYKKLLGSEEFKKALSSGEQIGLLGKGAFGEAYKYKSNIQGHEFEYVMKSTLKEHESIPKSLARGQRALKTEEEALKTISGDIMPSLYGSDKNKIFMEYMPGKTIRDIQASGQTIDIDIKKELESQMTDIAKKGYMNFDINPGNIMYDPQSKRMSWIDFGMSMKGIDEKQALDKMKEAFNFNSDTWSSVTSKTNVNIVKEPIKEILTNDINNLIENFEQNITSDSLQKNVAVKSNQQQAIKRMQNFNRVAESAVGAGLKSAHKAGRGHTNFNSGNSSGWNF